MKIIIVDNGSRHTRALRNLSSSLGETEIIDYEEFKSKQQDNKAVLILSGGSVPVAGHEHEYREELLAIHQAHNPIIGICLGFELIASAYGSKLKLKPKLHRVVNVRVTTPDLLVEGLTDFKAYEAHRWSVEEVKPPLVELARSARGVEVFKHMTKPRYGFQFHPEASLTGSVSRRLIAQAIQLASNTLD